MASSERDTRKLKAWLELGDNPAQWGRLREAFGLSEGFALFIVIVADFDAEELAVAALGRLGEEIGRSSVVVDAGGVGAASPVRRLLGDLGERPLAMLRTHRALSREIEAFERCFVQLNGRRDQIVEELAAPLVIITRRDGLRKLGSIAPDLFSVHAAQFQLASAHHVERPAWLLLPHEVFGLVGVGDLFDSPDIQGMASYLEVRPVVPERVFGRAEEIARLRTMIARSPRRIRVWGLSGAGKSVVIAAALDELGAQYERVLWLHGWAAHSVTAVLGAIVRALDEHGRCPADPIDIGARYGELTRAQRVLIVVEFKGAALPGRAPQNRLPAPAAPSLLIEEALVGSAEAEALLEVGPLSDQHSRRLWENLSDTPAPERALLMAAGRPAMLELLAGTWGDEGERISRYSKINRHLWSCDEVVYELGSFESQSTVRALSSIISWSRFRPELPRGVVDEVESSSELYTTGLIHVAADTVRLDGGGNDCAFHFDERGVFLAAVLAYRGSCEHEFVRRGLRLYTREWASEADDDEFMAREAWCSDWRRAPEALALEAFAALPVDERAVFARALAELRDSDDPASAFAWMRRAVAASVASGQLERARRLLTELDVLVPVEAVDPIWLADTKLVLALVPRAQLDDAARAQLIFEWEPHGAEAHPEAAALARGRYGADALARGGMGMVPDERGLPPPIAALEGFTREGLAEHEQFAAQTACPEHYLHFAHAHLCLLALRSGCWAEAEGHLGVALEHARAWGLGLPLLRSRLLALEFGFATGDLEPMTPGLEWALTRCDQLLGPLHPGTLVVLGRALSIRDQLGHLEAARVLADDIRQRLRYVNPSTAAAQSVQRVLYRFYEEHGPEDVASGLSARLS